MSALSWLYYSLLVGVLLAGGAMALESGLRAWRLGGRWSWAAALGAMLALPLFVLVQPDRAPAAAPPVLFAPVVQLESIAASASASSISLQALLLWGWLALSVLAASWLLLSRISLRRAARGWRFASLDGVEVMLTRDLGPAVIGVRRPRIVVPDWLLTLPESERALLLLHEEEHRQAGDSRLTALALLVCALVPWHPLAWWSLYRLRVAIELDCDERVLQRSREPAAYGRLLIEVGRRRSARYLLAAAFAEPRVLLERRVRALLAWPRARRPLAATVLGVIALLCFGFASAAPQPLASGARQPVTPLERLLAMPQDTPPLMEGPTFTPMTVRPELTNNPEVRQLLIAEYPPVLKDAGIGGAPILWFYIDETGVVQKVLLSKSGGHAALDSAALRVAPRLRFRPAENRGKQVPVWVEIPIVFGTLPGGEPALQAPRDSSHRMAPPTFTPVTDPPSLRNPEAVREAILKLYPPLLRDAGITGGPVLWLHIDETGKVTKAQLSKPSGYQALDEAALKVSAGMQFNPAHNRDQVVPVWIELPVMFSLGPRDRPTSVSAPGISDVPDRPGLQQRAITNQPELLAALVKSYPPPLRDAGIGGTVTLWLFVNEAGLVTKTQVAKSSGRTELDEAALMLSPIIRFAPAKEAGWVQVPFAFSAK